MYVVVLPSSANVLLDLSFRAKVGGFGFARSLENPSEDGRTARVVGTSGYISPECYNGRITTKMDAFSYGVVCYEGRPRARYDQKKLMGMVRGLVRCIGTFPMYCVCCSDFAGNDIWTGTV